VCGYVCVCVCVCVYLFTNVPVSAADRESSGQKGGKRYDECRLRGNEKIIKINIKYVYYLSRSGP